MTGLRDSGSRTGSTLRLRENVVAAALQREREMSQRHRFVSELDGPDYDAALEAGDAAAETREAVLYGVHVDSRIGWTREP